MNEDQHPARHQETLEPGQKKAICRCWKSKKFPYCDGSHRSLEGQHPPVGPFIVDVSGKKDQE